MSLSLEYVLRPVWEQRTTYAPAQVVRLELYLESADVEDNYQLIFSAEKVVPATGPVSFQVNRPLADQLAATCPAGEQVQLLSTVARRYYARTAALDAAGVPGAWTDGATRTAVLAGLPFNGFLTTQPLVKTVAPGEPEYLYFITAADAGREIVVERTVTLASGFELDQSESVFLPAARPGHRLLCIPVALFTAAMFSVRIRLRDAEGTYLTEPRVYQVEQPAPQAPRQVFQFASPAGGVDTLVATGNGRAVLEATAVLAERPPQAGDAATAVSQYVAALTDKRAVQVATDWLTAAQLRWLQAFVLSRAVWRWQPGSDPVSLVVSKRTLGYKQDAPGLPNLTFEYAFADQSAEWNELR